MTNQSISLVDVTSGAQATLILNEALKVGDEFRLVGRTPTFHATQLRTILEGTVEVVDGVSSCGRFQTSARICDTTRLAS